MAFSQGLRPLIRGAVEPNESVGLHFGYRVFKIKEIDKQ